MPSDSVKPLSTREQPAGLRALVLSGFLIAWCLGGWGIGFEPGRLFQKDGLANALALFQGFTSPALDADFIRRIMELSVESFAIGFSGLGLALVIGIPLGIWGARLPALPEQSRKRSFVDFTAFVVRPASRTILTILRSIPEIIWAFLFVRILGLGPGPAVIAIGLSFAGIIGKLFAELMESAAPEPAMSLRRLGASPLGVALYGVLPQVRHQWVGYGLFRLECAIRSAAILGVVGAGGLGSEIDLSIRYFQYDKLATALLALLLCVILLEISSLILRRSRAYWSIGTIAVGALWGSLTLGVVWFDLFTAQAAKQLGVFLAGFSNPVLDFDFVWATTQAMLETVGMALFATMGASLLAFMMAPLGAWQILSMGYLQDAPNGATHQRLFALVFMAVRLIFQVFRAMPELVWALIFVVWIGAGPMAGMMAIGAHTIGIMGRLFGEVYEDIENHYPSTLEARGAGRLGAWAYGVLPQAMPQLLSFALFRFEVNIRATAMVGFVGAGGIGDEIHTAISLFHFRELATQLLVLLVVVSLIDALSSELRLRIMAR
ncbi:MAG: ABC transporter permease subunit [Deltaproteobacteria bacterium]|jgi:phosphonate transport system permease protein|nr:ABC transporter permease subunit [Deltaproteobacteria bacterium]MBT6435970.1 ABC transporter permease subunit [Deltaproteobacteria bacterium]MBT6489815.1 ABC transporter permease subunit [Deltaproteobacteria bacterium]